MLTTQQLADLIMFFPALREAPPDMLAALGRDAESMAARPDGALLQSGQPCHGLALLTAGAIRVSRGNGSGRSLLLYRTTPGSVCALSAGCLLGDQPFPATQTSDGNAAGIWLPRSLFLQLLPAAAEFRELVFQTLARGLTQTVEAWAETALYSLERRLAKLLLSRAAPIVTTHQALADEMGSVREVISRMLKELESRGLVRLGRGVIDIADGERLRAVAEGATSSAVSSDQARSALVT